MNTISLSRTVRRAMLPFALLLGFLMWWNYGTLTVPTGMDTLPDEFPPGTLCVIDKRPGRPAIGQVVFVEVGGGQLLTRVSRVDGDRFYVDHDDRSRFPDGDALGPLPSSAVRSMVLTAFPAEPPAGGGARSGH